MASNLKTLDSVGGFSVSKTTLVNETKDILNVNSLEVRNSFYTDSSTNHYIMRGVNSGILSVDDVASNIILPANSINFIETTIVGVNDNASAVLSTRLDSAIQVDAAGYMTELSTMTTTVKDSIPIGQEWTITPFLGGAVYNFSYITTKTGTSRTIKWVAYVKVVSIDWT